MSGASTGAASKGADGARSWPRPTLPRLPAGAAYLLQKLLAPNRAYRGLASWLESPRGRPGPGRPGQPRQAEQPGPPGGRRLRYRLFTAAEKAAKSEIFGCRMCGQCALPVTGYSCPMTCPKQMRNGPCGGVGADGSCEVYPGMRCVWVVAYERAERNGRADDLSLLQRPLDHRGWGESSWVNYWQGRDEGLWTEPGPAGGRPGIWRQPPAANAGRK